MKVGAVLLCFGSLLGLSSAQIKACYAWDGSSSGNFPCDPEAEVSACCGPGSICMTSLYCTSQFNTSLVGCCTDRTWKSEACPYRLGLDEVTDPLTQHFSYANNVTVCDDGTVCPDINNQTCCTKQQGRTELNYHNRARLPESVTGLASYYSQAGYTIPGSSATASLKVHAAQSTSIPTTATESSTSSALTSTQSSAAATPSPTSAKQTLSPAPSSSGLSTGAKAGIGVGVAVAAMICATAAFIFWIRRRRDTDSGPDGGSHSGGWPWQGRQRHQSAAPAYFSPELGTDSAKFEVDASTVTQPSVSHELASEGVQKHG